MSVIIKWWAVAAAMLLLFYWFAVRGRVINWYGLFLALPGIAKDIACQIWLDLSKPFRRRKKIIVQDYERDWL